MTLPAVLRRGSLGPPWLTAAYWGTVALQIAAFWIPKFPPLTDYPQHLAIAALLRRWLVSGSWERQTFDVNLFTYNGAFHVLAAVFGLVVPMEAAGRLVLSLLPLLFAVAGLALVSAAQRPRWYALLILPLFFGGMVGWGFVNNLLGYGVGFLAFALGYRALQGEPNLWIKTAVLGLVVAYLHIFAAFVLTGSLGLVALHELVVGTRVAKPWRRRVATFTRVCVTLAPGVLLSGAFVLHNRASSHANWENGAHDGLDEYAWSKVFHFADLAMGNFADGADRKLFFGLLGVLGFLYWPRRGQGRGHGALRFLVLFFAFLYLLTPRIVFATWFMFERVPLPLLVFTVAAAPALPAVGTRYVRALAAGLAVATAVGVATRLAKVPEEEDANAILDAIPDGARVTGLLWDPVPWPVLERATWVHLPAYHQVRHRGEVAMSFAFIESLPLHYKASTRPPRPAVSFEWQPQTYAPSEPYAQYFDTILVLAPRDRAAEDPSALVFGARGTLAKVLAHHGRFWLYDASLVVRDAAAPPADGDGP